MPTSTVQDYLKTILHLDEDPSTEVSVGAIAENLEVTAGTVSSMMRHLSEEGLVDYVPRRSIGLRPKGRSQARQVVRRHRLLETFLVEVMKLDWSEVHAEAEVLEHAVSDRLLERIDEMLGHPECDPHGDPIPTADGKYPAGHEAKPLSETEPGPIRVVRVDDSDADFLNWLQEHHLLPGGEFDLLDRDEVAGILELSPADGGQKVRLGESASRQILVEPAD